MAKEKCYRCGWYDDNLKDNGVNGGVARVNGQHYDATAGMFIARDGRRLVTLTNEQLLRLFGKAGWNVYEPHLYHVDPSEPGLVGVIPGEGKVLLEGMHRATVNLRRGKSFKVYLLTARETERIRRIAAVQSKRKEFVSGGTK